MENSPSVAKVDNKLFISPPDKLNGTPPEFISGGDGVFVEEDEKPSLRLLEKGQVTLSQPNKKENDFIDSERTDPPFDSIPKKDETRLTEPKKGGLPDKQDSPFMDSFLIELVHNIKNALGSIYHATVLTIDKYDDVEIRKHSHAQVKEDIKKIDSVLNSVLNFININTPIVKTNTLYVILEEILEANEKQLRQKNIKISQKYEKDLPDTFIHPEQVRFILHSVLQYAILSTSPNKSIGFLIKSTDDHHEAETEKTLPENNRRYIEVMIGFDGDKRSVTPAENSSETGGDPKEGMAHLILKLAKEILQRNHGMMVENHGKRPETIITLRFPIERRKVVYYEPIAI